MNAGSPPWPSAVAPDAGTNLGSTQRARIDDEVLAQQTRTLYEATKFNAASVALGVPALVSLFWPVVGHGRLLAWATAVTLVYLPWGLGLYTRFHRHNRLPDDAPRWLRWQLLRYFVGSAAFGSAGVLLFTPDSVPHQCILFAFLFGLTSTLMAEAAQYRTLYLLTLPPLLLPIIVRAALDPNALVKLLGLLAATGLLYTALVTRNLSKTLRDSLVHRFTHQLLVDELQTQKRRAEDALAEAEEANRAKSRFLAAASHDLRQPVHALGLFVSALGQYVDGAQGRHILARVESTVAATEAMFNAMLDVSRLDASVLVPEVKPFAVVPLLQRLATEYTPRAEAKGLQLRLRAGAQCVLSDPTLLERVLRNYLGNAVRYTTRGGLVLGCQRRGALLRIAVWDTGVGIAADQRSAVYQEFYQIGNPERDRSKGLGLGLAIVARVAKLLGHPVGLASRPGRGSRFSIDVPLAPAGQAVGDGGETAVAFDDGVFVGACVLVIDDEVDAREAMSMLLRQWGCLVLVADGATQALALAHAQDAPLDAILSDFRLREGETGIEAIRSIEQAFGPTPAALVTGDTAPGRLRDAAASGFLLLHKPLNPLSLKQALGRLLS